MRSLHNLNGNFATDSIEIREVWDSNLEEEFSLIRSIFADYPFVSMDTEFPAVLVPSAVTSLTSFIFNYQNLKCNVDVVKLIQLGLTFFVNDSVQRITFYSFFDVGYLSKTLTCRNLPDSWEDFCRSLRLYFPKVYDIKHMMKLCKKLNGGLNKVAEDLGVKRVRICHQAGSYSLLVDAVFMKLKDRFFQGSIERYAGVFCDLCC